MRPQDKFRMEAIAKLREAANDLESGKRDIGGVTCYGSDAPFTGNRYTVEMHDFSFSWVEYGKAKT